MTSVSPASYSTIDAATGRTPPWSQEAEQAVLGAMLIDQDAALRAVELLRPEMFYREAHRRLFRAMAALTDARIVLDHVTLRDELTRRGELDEAVEVPVVARHQQLDHRVRTKVGAGDAEQVIQRVAGFIGQGGDDFFCQMFVEQKGGQAL